MPEIERGIHRAACLIVCWTLAIRFFICSADRPSRQEVAAQPRPHVACAVACHGTKPDADRQRTGGPTRRLREALWRRTEMRRLPCGQTAKLSRESKPGGDANCLFPWTRPILTIAAKMRLAVLCILLPEHFLEEA